MTQENLPNRTLVRHTTTKYDDIIVNHQCTRAKMKKTRKNKFSVQLTISKLLNVPYSHGYFFTKVKLKKGDVTVAKTQRTTVADNTVVWNETVAFECKIYTDASGLLIPCFLRISVRKEENGGKSVEKLGVVNIDLAQYAVGGTVERR